MSSPVSSGIVITPQTVAVTVTTQISCRPATRDTTTLGSGLEMAVLLLFLRPDERLETFNF
jgi:hypothetical protein